MIKTTTSSTAIAMLDDSNNENNKDNNRSNNLHVSDFTEESDNDGGDKLPPTQDVLALHNQYLAGKVILDLLVSMIQAV